MNMPNYYKPWPLLMTPIINRLKILGRGLAGGGILILFWQLLGMSGCFPPYLLPSPWQVAKTLNQHGALLFHQAMPTALEASLGLLASLLLGGGWALSLGYSRILRWWSLPLLIISQAIPTFAIAPLLVIWLGYGIASKIAVVCSMLLFPIASAGYDGLRTTPATYLDLAYTLNATPNQILWRIRLPAALRSFANGIRIAAAFAPMGAILGEWVGAEQGLGLLILNANAQLKVDLVFAALFGLAILTLIFYTTVDWIIKKLIESRF